MAELWNVESLEDFLYYVCPECDENVCDNCDSNEDIFDLFEKYSIFDYRVKDQLNLN